MVRGRLKRESNPTPGSRPGFTPQHDSTGSGDYVNTSPQNPLPVTDDSVEGRLQAIENKLDSVIENGAVNSQLTGSKVVNTRLIAHQSDIFIPAGTTVFALEDVDFSKYKYVFFQIRPNEVKDMTVHARLRRGEETVYNLSGVELESFTGTSNVFSESYELQAISGDFGIENKSGSDGTVSDFYAFGRLR